MALIRCKVTPNAKKTEIVGWVDEGEGGQRLRIKLAAPPVDGKANDELVRFLSKALSIPKSAVSIRSGEKSREKTVDVQGLDDGSLAARLKTLSE